MVGPTASFTPGSPPLPPPYHLSPLVLSLSLHFSFSVCFSLYRLVLAAEKRKRLETDGRKKREREGKWRNERREGRERERRAVPEVSAPPHRQCLTSVAVARPPRDESITLNNVNVSPSQHKTNNHCSLPRPMSTACSRGSPAPHSPFCLCLFPQACLPSPPSFPAVHHRPRAFLFPSVRPSVSPLTSAYLRLRGLIKKSPLTRGRLRFNLRIVESNGR